MARLPELQARRSNARTMPRNRLKTCEGNVGRQVPDNRCHPLDRGHLHNHFCFNSVSYLDGSKYNYSKSEQKRLRETSDRLCREYGLSVIENPKKAPSRPLYLDEKSGKPTRYNVYLEDLAEAISGSRDIPHMMKYLIDKGYEVDFSGGHWKMKLPQYKHFTR